MTPYYDEGGITIWHGDCREVLPGLPAGGAHLLLTDPPYGINYVSGRGKFKGEPLAGDDGTLDVAAAVRAALRCVAFNRHFYVFGPADLSAVTVGATTELIWDEAKFSGGDLGLPWGKSHERVTFGVWSPYPSQRGTGTGTIQRLRRGSVLRVPTTNNGRGARLHPTEKPIILLRQLIEASSLFDEVVLDPFMGAGSTLAAARLEGRRAIGIELEERYCEVAAKRLGQGELPFEGVA